MYVITEKKYLNNSLSKFLLDFILDLELDINLNLNMWTVHNIFGLDVAAASLCVRSYMTQIPAIP